MEKLLRSRIQHLANFLILEQYIGIACQSFGNVHGKKGLGFFPDGKKGRFSSWWEIPPRGRGNETAREYPHFLRFHPFDYLSLKRGISQIGFIQGYTMIE